MLLRYVCFCFCSFFVVDFCFQQFCAWSSILMTKGRRPIAVGTRIHTWDGASEVVWWYSCLKKILSTTKRWPLRRPKVTWQEGQGPRRPAYHSILAPVSTPFHPSTRKLPKQSQNIKCMHLMLKCTHFMFVTLFAMVVLVRRPWFVQILQEMLVYLKEYTYVGQC